MAQSFWPGQGFRSNVTSDTGAVDVARQAERLGRTLQDTAAIMARKDEEIRRKQEQDKYSTFKIEVKRLEAQYALDLTKEQDETKYDKMLAKLKGNVNAAVPKDGESARLARLYADNKFVDLDFNTKDATSDRLEDKWELKRDIHLKQYIDTGIGTEYIEHELSGIALYNHDASETKGRIEVARSKAEYNEGIRIVRSRPEEFLESLKDGKSSMLEDLSTVNNDPGKMLAMKNLAQGSISEQEIEAGRITLAQTATIKKAGIDPNTTTDFMARKIQQSDGLTPEQKITSMNLFTSSRRTMAVGGSNAYTTTENETLYTEHRRRAANRTITEQEIIDNVGPGGYSWARAEKLITIINGKSSSSKAFEESAAAENLSGLINETIEDDVALNQFATQRGLGLLEDALQNHPDWTDREKKEEALRIGRQLDREYLDGTLELNLERALEMTTEQRAQAIEEDLNKIDLAEIKRINKGIPRPKTKAEYDKLPSGTLFIDPDGVRRRKP